MYLVEIDENGLVKTIGEYDGVMAVSEFREVINTPELGIACFTAIALYADWLTPIRYYSENDRPKKAMQMVSGIREKWEWYTDIIQKAISKYMDLQPNPDLVEKRNLDNLINKKLEELTDEEDDDKIIVIFRQLNTLKDLRSNWLKDNETNDLFAEGPVRNGYLLSRLEEKREDHNSFYNK